MIRVGTFEEFNLSHKQGSPTPDRDVRVCPEGLLPKGGQSKVDCDGLVVDARIRVPLPTRSLHQGESQQSFEESRPTLLASVSLSLNRFASTTTLTGEPRLDGFIFHLAKHGFYLNQNKSVVFCFTCFEWSWRYRLTSSDISL